MSSHLGCKINLVRGSCCCLDCDGNYERWDPKIIERETYLNKKTNPQALSDYSKGSSDKLKYQLNSRTREKKMKIKFEEVKETFLVQLGCSVTPDF